MVKLLTISDVDRYLVISKIIVCGIGKIRFAVIYISGRAAPFFYLYFVGIRLI
jgi:hypothetical protein